MIDRPFETEIEPTEAPGSLVVRIASSSRAADWAGRVPEVEALFEALGRAGEMGGLGGDSIAPATSTLHFDGCTEGLDGFECRYSDVCVDSRTLFLVQNLVHRLHVAHVPVARLQLATSLLQQQEAMPRTGPPLFRPVPFAFEFDSPGKSLLVELELLEGDLDSDPLVSAWKIWVRLAAAGAFANGTLPPDRTGVIATEEPRAGRTHVTFSADDAAVSEEGIYCLVNMLQAAHPKVGIASVEIW